MPLGNAHRYTPAPHARQVPPRHLRKDSSGAEIPPFPGNRLRTSTLAGDKTGGRCWTPVTGYGRDFRLLAQLDQFPKVVEAGLGGGFGLGEEVFGAVGEFAGERGVAGLVRKEGLVAAVAEALDGIAAELETASPDDFNDTLQGILRRLVREHKRILFNGDGYTSDWLGEAARRGLPNVPTTPEALRALVKPDNVAVFERYGVMSAREMESRCEIGLEDYQRKVAIEGHCALEMASSMLLPVVRREYKDALDALSQADRVGVASGTAALREECVSLGNGLDAFQKQIAALGDALDHNETAAILSSMSALRTTADTLERRVSDDRWPLPKYREMLFVY